MDSAALVDHSIEGGKQLVAELDREGFDVNSALWLHDDEGGDWKLIIASGDTRNKDRRDAYKWVRRVIRNNPGISVDFDDVVITDVDDDLIKLLRRAVRTGPGIKTIRFAKNAIDNVLIDDAVIYRMQ